MVKGEDDSVYKRLRSQFDALGNSLHDDTKTTLQGITYVETLPVLEFERKNNTTIAIMTTKPKEFYIVQKNQEATEDTQKSISENFIPHRYASFKLGGRMQKASVNKSLKKKMKTERSCCPFLIVETQTENSSGSFIAQTRLLYHQLNLLT